MNSKVVAGILAIVAIVLAGVVFYQQSQLNEARQEIARLAEEKTLAEKAAEEAQKEAELAALGREQFIPMLVYRTGPYAPSGIPVANGFRDYYTMINNRDGGIGGVIITFEECETEYNTKLGVECYEKL